MARNTITDGPGEMKLMLALFDAKPAMAHGTRDVHIELACGYGFNMNVHRVEHNDLNAGDEFLLWTVWGETHNLPTGYHYFERNSLEIRFDIHRRKGYVDLELSCPMCGGTDFAEKVAHGADHVQICNSCSETIMRSGADTGHAWHWTTPEAVRQHDRFGYSLKVVMLRDGSTIE